MLVHNGLTFFTVASRFRSWHLIFYSEPQRPTSLQHYALINPSKNCRSISSSSFSWAYNLPTNTNCQLLIPNCFIIYHLHCLTKNLSHPNVQNTLQHCSNENLNVNKWFLEALLHPNIVFNLRYTRDTFFQSYLFSYYARRYCVSLN